MARVRPDERIDPAMVEPDADEVTELEVCDDWVEAEVMANRREREIGSKIGSDTMKI